MAAETFTLRVRRFDPESGNAPYWQEFDVDLEPERSVLDGILQAKGNEDGSLAIRCSCQAAICGSCGVRINGKSALACNTKLGEAQERAEKYGFDRIVVQPMGNMPVIKDLIVDMDAVPWTKVQRVVPWLLPAGAPRGRRPAAGGAPPGGGVHGPPGVDDRHPAVGGLHPRRRLRVGLPLDGGRP